MLQATEDYIWMVIAVQFSLCAVGSNRSDRTDWGGGGVFICIHYGSTVRCCSSIVGNLRFVSSIKSSFFFSTGESCVKVQW